jgi:hypothetical protein
MEEQNENIRKFGRPKLDFDIEKAQKSIEINRERARKRYHEKMEECKQQSKENTKKTRQVYQIIKELAKNNKLDLIQDEETKNKLKEVFS